MTSPLILTAVLALAADYTPDSPDKVKAAIAEGTAVLLDVREQKEWDAGHLKAATLLPLSRIEAGVPKEELEKKLPKGKIVYCHCKAGVRSLAAADELQKLGFEVRPLKSGYEALLKAGFEKAEK